jgi:hypothetical protein
MNDGETRKELFKVLDASRYDVIDTQDDREFHRVLLRKKMGSS